VPGFHSLEEFVASLAQPRAVIILVQAGRPVDAVRMMTNHYSLPRFFFRAYAAVCRRIFESFVPSLSFFPCLSSQVIESLTKLMAPGDLIIDGGNEWYENTERRAAQLEPRGLLYMGMGVSGGEEGARFGPALMPGGPREAFDRVAPILHKVAAQVDDGACVTYIGTGASGNYVKMVHNGIEYGDMQLIAEVYDVLKNVGGLSNEELFDVFDSWNRSELKSFLIEITADIFLVKDKDSADVYTVDRILDKTGNKGTGKWTAQQAAELSVPAPTMSSALDARYLSALLAERVVASQVLHGPVVGAGAGAGVDKAQLIADVRHALYAAKICSYAQGMNLIRAAGKQHGWALSLGAISRIWKGGCIIRAVFLDRIKAAYDRDAELASLLVDPEVCVYPVTGCCCGLVTLLSSHFYASTELLLFFKISLIVSLGHPFSLPPSSTSDRPRGAASCRPRSAPAFRRRRSRALSPITTRTDARVCRPISRRRSATTLARTRTSAPISRAAFTPSGLPRPRRRAPASSERLMNVVFLFART
jgi:6-phosphogluconate dehydrogenase